MKHTKVGLPSLGQLASLPVPQSGRGPHAQMAAISHDSAKITKSKYRVSETVRKQHRFAAGIRTSVQKERAIARRNGWLHFLLLRMLKRRERCVHHHNYHRCQRTTRNTSEPYARACSGTRKAYVQPDRQTDKCT